MPASDTMDRIGDTMVYAMDRTGCLRTGANARGLETGQYARKINVF